MAEVGKRVRVLRERGFVPGLATILVGDDDASAGYIRIKQRRLPTGQLHWYDDRVARARPIEELEWSSELLRSCFRWSEWWRRGESNP